MSILEKIRNRTGLLVGIVGLALVIFILESLLGSGNVLFSSDDHVVGSIYGKDIKDKEFGELVDAQLKSMQQANPNMTIDDNTRQQVVEQVWNQLLNDRMIGKEYDKLGITVTPSELYYNMLINPHQYVMQQISDRQTGAVVKDFARADGSLDVQKLAAWVNQMNPEQERFWKTLEGAIADSRKAEKYSALLKKGMYVTQAEAKDAYYAQNKTITANYVVKRYATVNDSTVKVSDEELQKYYNEHQQEYKAEETTRKIEYVSFDVVPSNEDVADLQKEMQKTAADFKGVAAKDDSSFIAQESENGAVNIASYGKKNMVVADSSIYTAPVGTVFGPNIEGAMIKIYKLTAVKNIADSARVRHILIGFTNSKTREPRSPEQAKKMADSVLAVLKSGKVKFDTLMKQVSDDAGSLDKGGDYGWFDENEGFVEPFKNAGLQGTKGNISIVETQFGYHIIEVLDVAKTHHNTYTIAQISRTIVPSDSTAKAYYKKASDFAGENKTAEAFEKAVDSQKLNKRIADNIKEGDRNLPGLENAKDLVRWVYSAKKGDVSEVMTFKDRYVVAQVVSVREKGILPLEDVKDDVTMKARRVKKGEEFVKEFQTKAGNASNIGEVASKMGLPVDTAKEVRFANPNLPYLGREDAFIGTVSVATANKLSKPIVGESGVYVLVVTTVNEPVAPKDYKNQQKSTMQQSTGRVDYEVYNALKEIANVEDHRGRFSAF